MSFFGNVVWFLDSNDLTMVVWQQNDITREDFVRGARVIVGDQVLVQTIRQMHQKVSRFRGSSDGGCVVIVRGVIFT